MGTIRKASTFVIILFLVFFEGMGEAAASFCPAGYYYTGTVMADRAYWGVENRIALPQSSSLPLGSANQHALAAFSVVDADPNLAASPPFTGCFGFQCQIQGGLLQGGIAYRNTGQIGSTGVIRPYVEERDKNGCYVNIFSGLQPSASSFFNAYDTGVVDSQGFHLVRSYFNNAIGGGNYLMGGAYLIQGSNFRLAAFGERDNFVSGSCSVQQNWEVGRYGYGTTHDGGSIVNILRKANYVWQAWDTVTAPVPVTVILHDTPYGIGFFHNFGAWTTSGS